MTTRNYSQWNFGTNVFGEWAYSDASSTITASSTLGLSAAVPVDTYSSGEYGYGNYSAGTYRDASVTINAVASVSAVGAYTANVQVTISAVSSSSLIGQVITGNIIPIVGASSAVALGNVTFSGNPFPISGSSTVTIKPVRILFITINPILAESSTNFNARLKWVDEPIATTNWTTVYKVAA
tara:strand:- start:6363 stop:6908 length:546 start_codon:yes stop_codon:yes gene_type:complete